MTTLLLVRHGATAWTHERRLQGRTDIDLSQAGRADVAALAPVVADWAPRTVIASPLLRARSTARLLAAALPDAPETRVDERWTEHSLGEWEGRTADQLGPDYARWRAGELTPPGGEPAAETRTRVRAAVADAAACSGPVLVVTHGGVIRAVLGTGLGLPSSMLVPAAAPSLTVLEVEPGGVRLRAFNVDVVAGRGG
ncbi:histidine phosphatase family protein [Cellulomonas pakistanensis]|uniref:Phosphatase n=1 Tax=Cellulomonas pakistanensis TaxID=992287 RepID=A0A919P791_9CELL|nr:histidine phosphatase family protein [Cellulomonas pakistanensis]GIG35610.1 phosphatase [Cellulomonas pakistanensis]